MPDSKTIATVGTWLEALPYATLSLLAIVYIVHRLTQRRNAHHHEIVQSPAAPLPAPPAPLRTGDWQADAHWIQQLGELRGRLSAMSELVTEHGKEIVALEVALAEIKKDVKAAPIHTATVVMKCLRDEGVIPERPKTLPPLPPVPELPFAEDDPQERDI